MTFAHRIALQVFSNPAFMRLAVPILALSIALLKGMPSGGGGGV
jgi:hypothetical protein